jgi:branched-chain amino acid transport system substrate-binding protein
MKKRTLKGIIAIGVFLLLAICINANAIAQERVIKIGVLGPMKFSMGLQEWWTAEIAADEINAAGGVTIQGKKYKVEVIKTDSNEVLSVVDAVSAAERLTSVNKVNFIIGGHRSEAALAIQELLADKKIIFLNTQAASNKLIERVEKEYERFKYFFRLQTNASELGKSMFAYIDMIDDKLKEELKIDKCNVAIVAEKAAWTEGLVKIAPGQLEKQGMKVVGVWQPSATATDVTAELRAVKGANAHIIFQLFSGPVGNAISREWGQVKIPAALAGTNTEGGTFKHWEATGGACQYEVVHGIFGPAKMGPKTLPLWDKVTAKHKEFLAATADGYDAIYILVDAVQRAGSLESDKVAAALEKTDYAGSLGRINFYPKGHKWVHDIKWGPNFYTMVANQWQDGKLKVVWPDGKHGAGYEGFRFEGTADFKLPPWVVQYWKGRSGK